MEYIYSQIKKEISDRDIIYDLQRVINDNHLETLTMKQYSYYGKFDCSTVVRRFSTWNDALRIAGIEINQQFWSEKDLFINLENVWRKKGVQPRRRDMDDKTLSAISSGAYLRKYGKWSNALEEFVKFINEEQIDTILYENKNEIKKHKTTRDINLRLRFKVLQRDNFKCCACGKSPATDSNVELQVDHIMPYAKGGETEIDNLQTLCKQCNSGKSDWISD